MRKLFLALSIILVMAGSLQAGAVKSTAKATKKAARVLTYPVRHPHSTARHVGRAIW